MEETFNQVPRYYNPEQGVPPQLALPPKKSLLWKIIIAIIIVFAAVLIGFTIVLATRIWDPLWNPFAPNPEKMITKSIGKMSELKSLHSGVSISMTADSEYQKFSFSGKIEGDSIISNSGDGDSDVKFTLNAATGSSSDMTSIGSLGMQVALTGGFKQTGQTQYWKIDSFPLAFSMFLPAEIKNLENKWIKISPESIDKIIELTQESSQNSLMVVGGGTVDEAMKKSKEFQKELTQKITDILKTRQFYSVDKRLSDEEINNVKTYHYKVSLKPDETAKTITEIIKSAEEMMLKEFGTAPSYPETEKMQNGIKEIFNKIGEISAEIWIGKKDGYIYKIKMDKEIDVSKLIEKLTDSTGYSGKFSLKLSFEVNYSKFNQIIKIEAPKDFVSFEDALMPLIEVEIKDSAIKSNLSYITGQISQYSYKYKTYYGITCKSPLVSSYCVEIKKIIGKDPIIRGSKNYYCIYSELFSKDNNKVKYYCLSKSNFSGSETITNPGLKGYCTNTTFICPQATSVNSLLPIY